MIVMFTGELTFCMLNFQFLLLADDLGWDMYIV